MTEVSQEAEVTTSARVSSFIQAGTPESPKISELGCLDWIGGLFVSLALVLYMAWFIQPIYTQTLRLLSLVRSLAGR